MNTCRAGKAMLEPTGLLKGPGLKKPSTALLVALFGTQDLVTPSQIHII